MSQALPVEYMARTRAYYAAQGFEKSYRWATFDSVPFKKLDRPLADSRVALITTAATYPREESDVRFVESRSIFPVPDRMYANDLAWDKKATHLDDVESYLPLSSLEALEADGYIGGVAERFHCVPTEYSQRRTREFDAPTILERVLEDGADIALLVPL